MGTWSLGARAGDFIFVAGMQGIDPATKHWSRIRRRGFSRPSATSRRSPTRRARAFKDCVRLTVYLSDLPRYAPMVEKAQKELWGGPPYPPRTMVEVKRLYDDDIVEIDSIFYAPVKK